MHTLTQKTQNVVMFKRTLLGLALAAASTGVSADDLGEALAGGKAYGDFLLRNESVEQDNAAEDSSALTLRSRLGYNTGAFYGFTATVEMEDSRTVFGKEDYEYHPAARPNGYSVRGYSVIADAPHTELDQGYLQYKTDTVTFTGGRQVITYDTHRFVGHVGWRQDRCQTYGQTDNQLRIYFTTESNS